MTAAMEELRAVKRRLERMNPLKEHDEYERLFDRFLELIHITRAERAARELVAS
jgi:hypothetical protein